MSDDDNTGELVPEPPKEPPSSRPPARAFMQVRYQESTLPPVEQMEGYERLLPGATKRLFDLIESDVASIQTQRRAQSNFMLRGQIFTFLTVMAVLAIATYCVATDASGSAAAIVTAVIGTGTVLAFYARHRNPPKS